MQRVNRVRRVRGSQCSDRRPRSAMTPVRHNTASNHSPQSKAADNYQRECYCQWDAAGFRDPRRESTLGPKCGLWPIVVYFAGSRCISGRKCHHGWREIRKFPLRRRNIANELAERHFSSFRRSQCSLCRARPCCVRLRLDRSLRERFRVAGDCAAASLWCKKVVLRLRRRGIPPQQFLPSNISVIEIRALLTHQRPLGGKSNSARVLAFLAAHPQAAHPVDALILQSRPRSPSLQSTHAWDPLEC